MQYLRDVVKKVCAAYKINETLIEKQILNAINKGCTLDTIQSILDHLVTESPNLDKPLLHISRILNAQIRVAHTETQIAFSEWEYIPDKRGRSLTERDIDILTSLFHHHYLDRDMLARMYFEKNQSNDFQNAAKTAIKRLYQAGLLMRLRHHERSKINFHKNLPAIYTLSRDGYLELIRQGVLKEQDAQWQPFPIRASSKINLTHELSVNRFCLEIVKYGSDMDVEIDWWTADESIQKVSPRVPGQIGVTMEPDSILWIGQRLISLIELEHSGRRKQMLNRLRRWNRYIALSGWQGYYPFMPWLLFVVPIENIANGATLQKMISIATGTGIQLSRVAVMPEEGPANDDWLVHLLIRGELVEEDFWGWASEPNKYLRDN